jgi:hypothetical protein
MEERNYGYLPSKLHGGQEGEVVGGLPALYVLDERASILLVLTTR